MKENSSAYQFPLVGMPPSASTADANNIILLNLILEIIKLTSANRY